MPPKTRSNLHVALIALPLITLAGGVVWQSAIASGQIEQNRQDILDAKAIAREAERRSSAMEAHLSSIDTHLEHISKRLDNIGYGNP